MILKILQILFLVFIHIQKAYNYQIRGQGHQISYILTDSLQKSVLVYRFIVSFDVEVQTSDYLEVYFPFSLRNMNQDYPKLRIVDYGDTSSYSLNGLEFYNQDVNQFQNCVSSGNSQLYYFKIQKKLTTSQLFIVEFLPEPYLTFPSLSSYSLDVVGFKIVSYYQQPNYVIYSHSTNIASLNFDSSTLLVQQFTQLNRISPNTIEVQLSGNINTISDIVSQNGGYVVVQILQIGGIQITVQSCSIQNCLISSDKLFLVIPFVGSSSQVLGNIILSPTSQIKPTFSLQASIQTKIKAFYSITETNSFILGNLISSTKYTYSNNQNLLFKNLLYHWKLPRDANNEVSIYVSSQTKYVYNKLTIQFQTDTNFALFDSTKEYFSITVQLGSQYKILSGSFVNNFSPISSDQNVMCYVLNFQVVCTNINQLLANTIYEISFKAIIFDQNQFSIQSINLLYNSGTIKEAITQVSAVTLSSIQYNFATNTDTTSQGTNQPWSSYLGDLQVISVSDVGTNTADTIAQKAFYSTSTNQGGGIFISRGVESIVFFLAINPSTLCNGNCSSLNKIIKMQMIANNNFLKFSVTDSSGLQLAAQNSSPQSYSFNGLDCSQVSSGCVNGSSNQVVDSNNYILNGKQVDITHNIVKYTLRCGQSGQAVLPSQQCANMLQGKEQNLGTYQNGYGGIFYIKQVDLSNSYIPSRVVADDQSPDFLITFSLEDPMNMSNNPIITLRTLINAYAISYYSTDNIIYNANFVNLSKDSQGLYNPSLLRLRVTNYKPNKAIVIFLDNSVDLTSFINEQQATYSCQVITQSDTLANYNKNSCLAYKGAGALTSTNYILNNVVMINTNLSGSSYLEILIPLSPSQTSGLNPTVLHVGYGILIDSFNKGLKSLAIQSLISVQGVSSIGPSLQTLLTSYFSITTLLNEDLTGQQKIYNYAGPAQSITFVAAPSGTALSFTDTKNLLNYGQIMNDAQYKGAGILITSVIQDPFQDQINFQSSSGSFPNQTGKCYKLSYYTSKLGENYDNPAGIFFYSIRYSVFCPFDDTNPPNLSPITVSKTQNPTNSASQFILAIQSVVNSALSIAISEKQGRNIAQQNIPIQAPAIINPQITITSPSSGYNVNVNFAFPLNFLLQNFQIDTFLNQPLGINIQVDNNLFQGKNIFTDVKIILNGSTEIPCTFSYSTSTLQISTTLNKATQGLKIETLSIQTFFLRTDSTATLNSNSISFIVILYYNLQYYMGTTPEQLKIFQGVVTQTFSSGPSSSITATIDKPIFMNNMKGSRDVLQFSFSLENSNTNKVSIDINESIQINLGFLRDPSKSEDNCLFYTDSTYQNLDHNIGYFSNYLFKFNTARLYTQKIFISCYGVNVYDQTNTNSYEVKYFNSLNQDMITTITKTQELILPQWNLILPKNGLSILSVNMQVNEAGLNTFEIGIQQNPTNLPTFIQTEFYIYLPIEIDLSEFMFTTSLESTTIYIAEKHALRIKVQSQQLLTNAYYLKIFPTQITKQLINAKSQRTLYVECMDTNSKAFLDYAYYPFNNINFNLFQERSPKNIYVTKASYNIGLQKAIDELNISFRVTDNYIYTGQNIWFQVYTRVGSQLNLQTQGSQYSYSTNGIKIFQQQSDIDMTKDIQVQISTITASKFKTKDLIFIPIYICLYVNSDLVAMTHNTISNLIGLPLLSSSKIYTEKSFLYFSDYEGDQVYSYPLYYNMIDKSQTFQIREMNGISSQIRSPLLNMGKVDQLQCQDDIYLFKEDRVYSQQLQDLYLKKQQSTQMYIYIEDQNIAQMSSTTNFVLTTFKNCIVNSEFPKYFVKQGQNSLTVRLFLDDNCQILDPNFNPSSVSVTVQIPAALGTIVGSQTITLTSNKVIFYQINVSGSVAVNTEYNIQYSATNLPNISIQNTIIVPYTSDSLTLSLSSLKSQVVQNQLILNISCDENKLIFYEILLTENKQNFLQNSDLILQAQNGAIRQSNQNNQVEQQQTHLIGSIQCNPSSTQNKINNLYIKWLRASTKYSLNLLIEGSNSSTKYDLETIQIATNPLLFIQLGIVQQLSLSSQQNPNLIRSQFLCYLSYTLGIPHTLIRFSGYPTASCQQYLNSNYQQFQTYANGGFGTNQICQTILSDSQWNSQNNDQNVQFFPIEYMNDTSIFVELDFSQIKNKYINSLKALFQNQYQIILFNLNRNDIFTYIGICERYYNFIQVQNYGNKITPKVKVAKNSCSSELRCNFYIEQTSGSSIIYLMISDYNLTESVVKQLNIAQFRSNSQNFIARYIYPLDENKTVQFNLTIKKADKTYFAYYFLTDLTLQDYAYQFPGVYNDTIIYITTYSVSNLILYIVIPLAAVTLIGIIYFIVKYYRNKNKVQPTEVKSQDAESHFEEIQNIKDNGNNKLENILDDLKSEQRTAQIGGDKPKLFKCQQIVSKAGEVNWKEKQNKVISEKVLKDQYQGKMEEIDEVVLL